MAYIHSTWLAGSAGRTSVRLNSSVISVELHDGITITALKGDPAAELGRTLVHLGEQVQVLDGRRATDDDELIVRAFLDGEGLGQASAGLFHRFIAYRESVLAHPYDNELVADLETVDQ